MFKPFITSVAAGVLCVLTIGPVSAQFIERSSTFSNPKSDNPDGKGAFDKIGDAFAGGEPSTDAAAPIDCDGMRVKLDLARGRPVQITDVATAILANKHCPKVIEDLAAF